MRKKCFSCGIVRKFLVECPRCHKELCDYCSKNHKVHSCADCETEVFNSQYFYSSIGYESTHWGLVLILPIALALLLSPSVMYAALEDGNIACYSLDNLDENSSRYGSLTVASAYESFNCKKGKCYTFVGASSYLEYKPGIIMPYNWTVSFWGMKNGTAANQNFIGGRSYDGTTGNNDLLFYYYNADQNFYMLIQPAAQYNFAQTISSGAWNLWTVTKKGDNVSFFVNGSLMDTRARAGAAGLNFTMIGAQYDRSNGVIGNIDDVMLWDRPLTYAEVASLYNSGNGVPCPVPVGDITAPTITLSSINSTYNDTYSSPIIWLNFSTDEQCTSKINNTLFKNFTSTNATSFSYNESGNAPDGYYHISINCTDAAGNVGTKDAMFTIDRTAPQIIFINPLSGGTQFYTNRTYDIEVNFTDNFGIYYAIMNMTINASGGFCMFNATVNLSTLPTKYNFSQRLNTTGSQKGIYRFNVSVWDAHTSVEIPSAEIAKDQKKIRYKWSETWVKIESLDSIGTRSSKKKDRYSFGFDYDILGQKTLEISSNRPIIYLPSSTLNAHFIIDGSLWADFEGVDAVTVNPSENGYTIMFDATGLSVDFNSIGFLNYRSEIAYLELLDYPVESNPYDADMISQSKWFNTKDMDTTTTPGVLIYVFLFLILVFLIFMSEYSKVAVFGVFAGLYGFFLSYVIYAGLSAIAGVFLIIFSLLYIIRSVAFAL